ncbi:MAG TPA: hypothetical protein VM490_18200 [Armatimonadaceae bacterium]|nr:hypothetical protein [Armatimonadaceae bacterium]
MQQAALAYARPGRANPAVAPTSGVAVLVPDPAEVSVRLLLRLVRLFRDTWFLSRGEHGFCWAGNRFWERKRGYDCDAATIRRHYAILAAWGWVQVSVRGPQRRVTCLVTPADVAALLPGFARLLRPVLRGSAGASPIATDRGRNDDRRKKAPPVAGGAAVVVPSAAAASAVEASGGEMDAATAASLAARHGEGVVADCARYLAACRERGKRIERPGAWLRACVERVAAKDWTLPGWLFAAEAARDRAAEREAARASRTVRAPSAEHAAAEAAADPLDALPEAERAALLDRAVAAVLAEALPPPVRSLVVRQGAHSPLVRVRARALLTGA